MISLLALGVSIYSVILSSESHYIKKADALDMDWKVFRDMYDSLHPEVKEELDNFLSQVYYMKTWEKIFISYELCCKFCFCKQAINYSLD